MHCDEANNATILGDVLDGSSYHYDPEDRHGPGLILSTLPIARIAGITSFKGLNEWILRLAPVCTGALTILLLGAASGQVGSGPAILAALLYAIAPLTFYYNRYFIHETLFVAATLGLILSGWKAFFPVHTDSVSLANDSRLFALIAGFSAGLMVVCKETAVLHFFAILPGIALCLWVQPSFRPHPKWPILLLIGTGMFLFTILISFTWGFKNWDAIHSLIQSGPRFLHRAGGEGHEKPFLYYLRLLASGWPGIAFVSLACSGILCSLRKPDPSNPTSVSLFFFAIYSITIFLIYSLIPYKTPWLALNLWLPFSLLIWTGSTGWASPGNRFLQLSLFAGFGLLLTGFAFQTRTRVFLEPADPKNPYAYAHTVTDFLHLPQRLDSLSGHKKSTLIAVVAEDPWPLPWYLREYPNVGYWQPGQEVRIKPDFYITSSKGADAIQNALSGYQPEHYGLRPECMLILWRKPNP